MSFRSAVLFAFVLLSLCGALPHSLIAESTESAATPAGQASLFTEAVDQSRVLAGQAFAARDSGDVATFVDRMEEALRLRPNHPQILYYCAIGHAEANATEPAMARLGRLAEMGLGYPISEERSFESIRSAEGWPALVQQMSDHLEPTTHSEVLFRLDVPELLPEGVAYDTKTGRHFVGGIRGREVWVRETNGESRVFVSSRPEMGSVFGLIADADRRVLCVATAWMAQTPGVSEAVQNTSALFCFDLDSGAEIARYDLPESDGPQILNDLCLAEGGDVFATDNQSGAVYRLSNGHFSQLQVTPSLASPQGVVLGPSEKRLYIADYSLGIVAVDLETEEATRLWAPDACCLIGIDGLARHGRELLAIQNGVSPHRILGLKLSEEGLSIESTRVLEKAHPEFDEPTLGTVVGNEFHYVANSQWPSLADDGGVKDGYELRPPTILRLPLAD